MIRLVKKAASAIANAAAGTKWFFIDNDGFPATKDESGTVDRFATEASVGSAIFADPKNSIEIDSGDDDLQLVGDTPSPGNNKFYATDGSGNRGWQDAPGATSLYDTAPESLGTASAGVSAEAARGDHVHAHGDLAGGALHAEATDSVAGFMPAADKAKADHLTVTAATNLDSIRTRVDELDAAVVLQGEWDPTTGSFPGGGSAQPGQSWLVTGDADVDGEEFRDGDRITALVVDASTTVYAGNWLKQDYTDRVSSIHGRVGNVVGASGDYNAEQIDETATAKILTAAERAQIAQLTNYVDKGTVSSGTSTLSYTEAKVQRVQAGGDFTLAHSDWPASEVPADMEVVAVNWGAHTVTLPASWNWGDAGAPTFSSSGRDRIILRTDDGGTTVDAMLAGSGF